MKLCLEKQKFKLSFAYDERVIAQVKTLPCFTWNKTEKVWCFPATALMYKKIKELLKVTCYEAEVAITPRTIDVSKHKYKTLPFKHQKEAVVFLLNQFGFEVRE